MKKMLFVLIIITALFLVGCMVESREAYFNMPCDDSCETSCDRQDVCDNICINSGIRINNYQHENKVLFMEGKFICKCY